MIYVFILDYHDARVYRKEFKTAKKAEAWATEEIDSDTTYWMSSKNKEVIDL